MCKKLLPNRFAFTSLGNCSFFLNLALQDSHPPIQNLSIKHTPKSDHKTPEELDLDRIETKLRTIQLGLEILTGVCATLPDPESPTEKEAYEGPDDDQMDEEEDIDIDISQIDASSNPNADLTRDLLPNFIHPLLSLIEPTPLSFAPAAGPSLHPPTTSVLTSIHICAFECLNNIFLSLAGSPHSAISSDVQSGMKVWKAIWMSLEKIGDPGAAQAGAPDGGRKKLWEIGVGVLWGISIVFRGSIVPEDQHVQTLMSISDAAQNDDSLKVKCIGTLECLAQHPELVNANQASTGIYYFNLIFTLHCLTKYPDHRQLPFNSFTNHPRRSFCC
jgi:hypothetical protein